MKRTRRRALSLTSSILATTLAGCFGGSSNQDTTTSPKTTESATTTNTPTATQTTTQSTNTRKTVPLSSGDYPYETQLTLSSGDYVAYKIDVPSEGYDLKFEFQSQNGGTFDIYTFTPNQFDTYQRAVEDTSAPAPNSIDDLTNADTGGAWDAQEEPQPRTYYTVVDYTKVVGSLGNGHNPQTGATITIDVYIKLAESLV